MTRSLDTLLYLSATEAQWLRETIQWRLYDAAAPQLYEGEKRSLEAVRERLEPQARGRTVEIRDESCR